MRAGEATRRHWLRAIVAGACLTPGAGPTWAIDNPDAPDWTAAFTTRAQPLEARWSAEAGGPGGAAAAQAYARFLDAELNQAYQALLQQLPGEARRALVQSQRQWLAFRAAETRFIHGNFTPQNFGSSSALSRADYGTSLVKQRVLTLLAYLQNYPAPPR
jgi:uncharacterized protein YecT (DUF1311 family)